jgi:hypothetical protein
MNVGLPRYRIQVVRRTNLNHKVDAAIEFASSGRVVGGHGPAIAIASGA